MRSLHARGYLPAGAVPVLLLLFALGLWAANRDSTGAATGTETDSATLAGRDEEFIRLQGQVGGFAELWNTTIDPGRALRWRSAAALASPVRPSGPNRSTPSSIDDKMVIDAFEAAVVEVAEATTRLLEVCPPRRQPPQGRCSSRQAR